MLFQHDIAVSFIQLHCDRLFVETSERFKNDSVMCKFEDAITDMQGKNLVLYYCILLSVCGTKSHLFSENIQDPMASHYFLFTTLHQAAVYSCPDCHSALWISYFPL